MNALSTGQKTRDSKSLKPVLASFAVFAALVVCMQVVRTGAVPALMAFSLGMAVLFLLGIADVYYLFLATILLLPFEVLYVPELPLNVQVVLLLAMAGLILSTITSPLVPRTVLDRVLLAYLFVMVISIVQTYLIGRLEPPQILPRELGWRASPYRGWYHFVAIGMGIGVLYFTVKSITSAERLKTAVVSFLSISFVVSVFSVYEVAAKLKGLPLVFFSFQDVGYTSLSQYAIAGFYIPRAYGSAGEPSTFGSYLLLPFSLAVSLLISRKEAPGYRRLLYALLATVTLAILLTFSTSTWLGALVSVSLLLAMNRFRRAYLVSLPLALALMAYVFLFPTDTRRTMQSVADLQQQKVQASLGGDVRDFRYLGWQRSFGIISQFPILGVGLGNEPFWMDSPTMNIGSYNILLTHLAEMGVLGFATFLYLIIKLVRTCCRAYKRALDPEHAAISLGCAAAVAGSLTSHMAWGGRLASWEWFIIGLGLAAQRVIQAQICAARQNLRLSRALPNGLAAGGAGPIQMHRAAGHSVGADSRP
jgi:O-antigen ligase